MEKYRRWTDEATGINPFISPDKQKLFIGKTIFYAIVGIIKTIVFLICMPILFLSLIVPFSLVQISALNALLIIFSLFSIDDGYFKNAMDKQKQGKIILSNHSCFIDAIYLLRRNPWSKFIVFGKKNCRSISAIYGIWRAMFKVQGFLTQDEYEQQLKSVIGKQKDNIKRGMNVIVFYEQIRTNGFGTIQISKKLCEQLFECNTDFCFVKLKHTPAREKLLSLTGGFIRPFFAALSCFENQLKVRALIKEKENIHSANQLLQALNQFLVSHNTILLSTQPDSFKTFLDFYQKTKKGQYIA